MLGDRCGKLGLQAIEQSKFALWKLIGKTLVVATEQPDIFVQASDKINSIISGETVTIERKYFDAVDIKPHAKILWAMNELPRIGNVNNGIMRRVKVIKFPVLPECERDPELKEQIKTEGAGILNWALIGLDRLRKRGKFLFPKSVMDATRDFQEHNDVPMMFIEEIGARINPLDPQCRTASQYLYDQYKDWCMRNGHKPMSSTRMADEWKRLGFERTRIMGSTYWQGIEISAFTSASHVP
jgi:putative DNA primase/helicase